MQGRSHPGGWLARDCVILLWRLTTVRTVRVRRSGHVMRSGQPRIVPSPGRRRELRPGGLARGPTGAGPDRCCELRQRPQIRWRWRREACSSPKKLPKRLLAETAPGWTTWKRCRSKPVHPEVPRTLLQISHADTSISVRFRCPRRSTPPDLSDSHLPDSAREERMLTSPLSRAGAWKTIPRKGPPILRRGPGAAPAAEAASPPWAGGPRAGQVRPPWT